MPKRCSCALNSAATDAPAASSSGKLNQLTLYTSRPSRARRSRATTSSKPTCPPWALSSTSFLTPVAATDSAMSVHSRMMVSALSVRVPANAVCSGLKPTACVGRNSTDWLAARCGSAAATTPSTRVVSTFSGKCGPCCSIAATGNTATVRDRSSAWKSGDLRFAQWRMGDVVMGAFWRNGGPPWRQACGMVPGSPDGTKQSALLLLI